MIDRRSSGAVAFGRRDAWMAQCVPVLAALWCYWRALSNGFAYDDALIVQQNYTIHTWDKIPFALRIAYWYTTGRLYRPLTTLSFALQWILSNGSPVVFHAVSLLLHIVISVLVVRLALKWWPPVAAGVAGTVFAVWPLHVEAVANVVGQSELWCALMLMLVIWRARAVPSRQQYLAIGLLSAAAIACKETGVVAPMIVWGAARLWNRAWRPAVLASACGVVIMIALRLLVLDTFAGDSPHAAFAAGTHWQALALALASYPHVLRLLVFPARPSPDYSPTLETLQHPNLLFVAIGLLLISGAIIVLIRHGRRPTPASFALVFAIATFAPVCNLVIHTGVVIAERTLYSPSIGVALLFGAGVAAVMRMRVALVSAVASAVVVLECAYAIALTVPTVGIWKSSETLFTAMLDRSPTSYRSYAMAAAIHPGDAHTYYGQSLALFPADPLVLQDAGHNAVLVGDTARALSVYGKAVALDPANLRARTSFAVLLLHTGDTTQARAVLAEGLRRYPDQQTWRTMLYQISR